MAKANILIVEDDGIIAMDLESRLKSFGYSIPAITSSGEESVQKVEEHHPDLVLMDIVLKGEMDGIEAAEIIRSRFGIPVIFITAYADEKRLERAKLTTPFGFILKPFQDRDLKVTIEMALYVAKADAERKRAAEALRRSEEELRLTLDATTDGIWKWDFMTNELFFSPRYYTMLGYESDEFPSNFESWRNLLHPDDIQSAIGVAEEYLKTKPNEYENEFRLKTKGGRYRWIRTIARVVERSQDGNALLMIGNHEDITERKQAETALRKSEEKYRTLLETTSEGFWLLNPERKTIEVNQALYKMLDYSQDEMLGKTPFDFVDDENRKIFIEQTSKISSTKHRSYEITLKKKNGEDLHTHFNATTIRAESGEVQGSFALITDITERKQAEEDLHKFEAIISTVADPMSFVDKNYIYRTVNDAYARVFNKSCEEIIGRSVAEMLGQDAFDNQIKGFLNKCLGGEKVQYNDWFDFPDGKRRYMDMNYYPYFDKGREVSGIVSAGRDETELELARSDLKRAHLELNQVFNSSTPLCMIDKDYTLRRENKTFCQLFELEEETVHNKKCYEILQTSLCNTPKCPMQQIVSGNLVMEQESKIELSDDRAISCLVTANPIESDEGKFLGIVECFMDITQLNSARKEKEKLEVQLQQAQKMESIGTLAGGIAHDFNNILFPMMGYTEMMLDDLPADSPHRKNTIAILQGTKRARDLIKQILAFSRQAGHELKPLKVQLIIREVLELIRSSLPSTIEIKQNVSNKCGLVMADFTQIHQITMNLMTNAFHAMEDEGGEMEVTLKEVELGLDDLTDQSMTPGAYVCLTVADTGPGMDQSVIDRIFEPYFTTKEQDKGTGLGLAVVHGIVKSYEGDIKVYSEFGEGTAFHVYLPVIKTQVETEETEAVTSFQKGTEQILLVDDEEPIVRMESEMLERLGYQVTARTSSVEALEAFRDSPARFDLVITDMTMPNMTGVQLSQKLLEIRPDIPIIICTGFSTKIDNEKATAAGIRGYVMKPVVMSELAKKIREVLGQD